MKAKLFDISGKAKSDIELPAVFDTTIRSDIAQKYFEVDKLQSRVLHSAFEEAGKRHSASGTISHKRHEWKGHYGKGIARVPRKTMWRRGTQFYWIGAEVASTRGGRTAHGPSGIRTPLKMNKKELILAFNSAIAATASKDLILKRYSTIKNLVSAPLVIESLPKKSKELIAALKLIFGESFNVVLKKRSVRAGVGKNRGRKYKSTAGLLIVTGKEESKSFAGLEVKSHEELGISDLFPLGRLTLYTKKAIHEMESKK